jgi:hypothetical protein
MPGFISTGAQVSSAATVVTPTNLAPALPTTRTNGEWLFCFTACPSATPTVATPSGWQLLWNVTGANGRLACFGCKVTGSESAPTVTWSSLTTGASGTPCTARVLNWGSGWLESAGLLLVDTLGAVTDQAASSTISAGGTGFTTSGGTYVFAHGVKADDALTGIVDAGGEPVPWVVWVADTTTSGADMMQVISANDGPPAGSVINDHSWTLTGGASFPSSGLMIGMAVSPPVDAVDVNIYTRDG